VTVDSKLDVGTLLFCFASSSSLLGKELGIPIACAHGEIGLNCSCAWQGAYSGCAYRWDTSTCLSHRSPHLPPLHQPPSAARGDNHGSPHGGCPTSRTSPLRPCSWSIPPLLPLPCARPFNRRVRPRTRPLSQPHWLCSRRLADARHHGNRMPAILWRVPRLD